MGPGQGKRQESEELSIGSMCCAVPVSTVTLGKCLSIFEPHHVLILKVSITAPARLLRCLKCLPIQQKVACSIPVRAHMQVTDSVRK